jgi:hypothetical protein
MNREPCSITDDPFNDYSDYVEGEGVYKSKYDPEAEDKEYEEERQKQIDAKHPLELYATFINSLMERYSAK